MNSALIRRASPLRTATRAIPGLLSWAVLGIALASWAMPSASQAQVQPKPPAARPAAKPPVKPRTKPAEAAPAPAATLPDADNDQMLAASITHLGDYACEFNETVKVSRHARSAGYVDVHHRKAVFTMKPVLSQTGALRLEDVRGRMLLLQIANKSMLMDVKVGQRVVDNCVHDKQRDFANQPPRESLGIAAPAAAGASAPR